MPIVIGARFSPYSFDDMLKPLAMAQQEYNTVQEGLSSLTDSSNQFSRYLEGTEAGERVKQFNAAIDTAVTDMAKNGLRGANRDTLLGLKRQYNNDIAKINQSAAQLDTLYKGVQAAQLKAQASGDRLFVANMPTVDDLLTNPSASPTMVSAAGLEQQGMLAAKALVEQSDAKPQIEALGEMYNNIVSRQGYNSEAAQKFLQNASTIPALAQAIDRIESMYGVQNLGENSAAARQAIVSGMFNGLSQKTTNNVQQNPEYMLNLQTQAALQKKMAESGADGGYGTSMPISTLNVPGVNKEKEQFKQYFTEDGKLTKEGLDMYRNGRRESAKNSEEAAAASGLGWAPSQNPNEDLSFRDFVKNTLKVKGTNGVVRVADIEKAWEAYNSPSSPAYGDTDAYRAYDLPLGSPSSQQRVKNRLARIYNGEGEVPIVNSINKDKKSFAKKDTIKMEDLMSDDYQVDGMQFVPYTKGVVVNFVSKKGEPNVTVELPIGNINQGAAIQLQEAVDIMENLDKQSKADPSVRMSPFYTRYMYIANQKMDNAMKAVLQYYDAEATK